jgi:hypothetical protein
MKTTFELSDNLFRQAKVYAAIQGISLKDFISQAISEKLAKSGAGRQQKPWLDFYDRELDLTEELDRLDTIIESEFETVNLEEWR